MNRPIAPPPSSTRSSAAQDDKSGLPRWATILIVLAILGAGIGSAVVMVKTKKKPQKSEENVLAPLVEVTPIRVGKKPISMQLNGEVTAAQQVVLMPEVGGRIRWQSPKLVPGGMVDEGEPLVRLDARDYALAVQQQQAQLANQELNLRLEKGRKTVAQREWDLFNQERERAGLPPLENDDEDNERLALREPQLQSAKVAVESANSALARAKLQLSKTNLTAPFNAFVQSESVEVGQLVSPGYQLATLVGTDAFWVRISVPVDKLSFISFPKGDQPGSKAKVSMEMGKERVEREGTVLRLLGDLDPVGRLARIIVEIPDPFGLKQDAPETPEDEGAAPKSNLPLLVGSFVRAAIEGVELKGIAEIPRVALRENDRIFVLTPDDTLDVRTIDVVWGDDERVLIDGAVKDGERLILSPLPAPVEGMKLRTEDGSTSPDKGAGKDAGTAEQAKAAPPQE
jgi:multidrug efflux pump subunit AcrA (membrane-fusion protein)